MSAINNFLWVILLLIFSSSGAQSNVKEKIFLTADSLASIHLLPNNQFGFISYIGYSPYNDKSTTRSYCGAIYELNENGSGTYKIGKNKLFLNFETPKHPVDSISRTLMAVPKDGDSILVKINIKSYVPSYHIPLSEWIGVGTKIVSNDGTVNANTEHESYAEFKLAKSQLPINISVKGYDLEIKENENHYIELFFNHFKTFFLNMDVENKIFYLKDLSRFK